MNQTGIADESAAPLVYLDWNDLTVEYTRLLAPVITAPATARSPTVDVLW